MPQDNNQHQAISDDFFDDNGCSFSIYPKLADFEPHPESCYLDVVVNGKIGYRDYKNWVVEFPDPDDAVAMFTEGQNQRGESPYILITEVLESMKQNIPMIKQIVISDPCNPQFEDFEDVSVEHHIVIKPKG